jgi:predicted AlkP superfamily phosphohydrolase/phosphomutase
MDTSRIQRAIIAATVSRGPRKGMLLASCPAMQRDAAAAWQAITAHANPYKLGIMHLVFMSTEQREIYDAVDSTIKTHGLDVRVLDRDRVALEQLGAW